MNGKQNNKGIRHDDSTNTDNEAKELARFCPLGIRSFIAIINSFTIPFFIVCSFNFNVNNLCDTFYAKLRLVFERFVW